MERASKLIRGLSLPRDTMTVEELACAAWPEAVGKKIAAHTRAWRLVRTRLVVEVEDNVWQRQLFALTRHIVANLEKSVGQGLVEDIEFRVTPRRMEPGRAVEVQHRPEGLFDEAAGIADPVLRDIYRASRRRALA